MNFETFTRHHPALKGLLPMMEQVCDLMADTYKNGGKIIVCGNGGSCADADHIVGELMKSFILPRPLNAALQKKLTASGGAELAEKLQTPLRAINLSSMQALSTAFANDVEPDYVYAQLALAYTDPNDVFIGISTSGNARNVHFAAITAKAAGARLVGLTGISGGKMSESGLYDVVIRVPEHATYLIQEGHIAVYHAICIAVEERVFA